MSGPLKPQDRVIAALDVKSIEEATRLVQALAPVGISHFKIGLGLFTAAGPASVEAVHRLGGKVFLDLKFYDIPSTVGRAVQAATRLGIWMANLHIQGGSSMMRHALAAAGEESARLKRKPPILIGVTVLTSMAERDLADLGVRKTLKDQVLYLAKLAKSVGLNGIVASPQEAKVIRWACGEDFLIVTPGIRPAAPNDSSLFPAPAKGGARGDDQQRTATPSEAVSAGADYIVVGRPIWEAPDPAQAAKGIVEKLQEGSKG